MNLSDVIEIKTAEKDSHFCLSTCRKCGSDNVAYVHYNAKGGDAWRVECFDCGYTVDKGYKVRHDAQVAWNMYKKMPCHGCPDRYPACSGHCEKPEYLEWQAEQEKIRQNRKKYKPPIWKHGDRDPSRR